MQPGRELDALIAEKVFGCKVRNTKIGTVSGWETEPHCDCPGCPHEFVTDDGYGWLKEYSTKIEDAWAVVERMKAKYTDYKDQGTNFALSFDGSKWTVGFQWHSYEDGWTFSADQPAADTAPHAICLAALKALGVHP